MGSVETASPPHKVVETTLKYHFPVDGKVSYVIGTAASYRRKFQEHPTKIHDIRGREDEFSLEKNGFQLYRHETKIENLLKKVTGATRAHVVSHLKRLDNPEDLERLISDPSLPGTQQTHQVVPARFVHIDVSENGAVTQFHDNIPLPDQRKLLRSRWAIINVWRPLQPIKKDPLGICDARTVDDADLFPINTMLPSKGSTFSGLDQGSRGRGAELLQLKYNPEQTWYYASNMTSDEMLLFKNFDTKKDGARRSPHSAFVDPNLAQDNPTRQSIEFRCFVFWEDQPVWKRMVLRFLRKNLQRPVKSCVAKVLACFNNK